MPRDADPDLQATPGTLAAGQTNDAEASDVQEVVNQLRQDFARRDRLYDAIDKIVYLEDEVTIPTAYQKTALEMHSPLPLHIPQSVTAALSINPPKVRFPPVYKGDKGTQNASLRERFFDASWRKQQEDADRQLSRAFMFSLVSYGEAIFKTTQRTQSAWAGYAAKARKLDKRLDDPEDEEYGTLDQEAKDSIYDARTEEMKRGLPYPITTTDVDPRTFYYWKTLDGMTACAEVADVPYADALARYDCGLDKDGIVVPQAMGLPRPQWKQVMSSTRTITLIQLWTWDRCRYVLIGPGQKTRSKIGFGKGTIVKTIRHGYGNRYTKTLDKGPYQHCLGVTTNSRLPHRAGMGILTPFLELFPQINSLLTIQGNAAYLTGFPSYRRRTPQGAGEPANPFGDDQARRGKNETDVVPGKILPYDIEPVDMPKGGVDLDKFLAHVMGLVELAHPRVLQGSAEQSSSGYEFNQATYLAKLNWNPIVGNAESAHARRVGFESWLIENKIREAVHVYGAERPSYKTEGRGTWYSISPKDIDGANVYQVSLDPELPANKLLEERFWGAALKDKLASPQQAQEAMGFNPDEVEEDWLLWEMKQDPAVKARLRARVLEQLGIGERKVLTGQGGQPDLTQPDPNAPMQPQEGQPNDAVGNVRAPGAGMPLIPPQPGGPMGPGMPGTAPMGPVAGAPGGMPSTHLSGPGGP